MKLLMKIGSACLKRRNLMARLSWTPLVISARAPYPTPTVRYQPVVIEGNNNKGFFLFFMRAKTIILQITIIR